MTNEDLLQKTLGMTIERIAKIVSSYESEIVNLNAQLIIMQDKVLALEGSSNSLDTSSALGPEEE
jgi:hypothetical protein